MSTIIDALNWRYATKAFDTTKKVSEKDLENILEATRLTASSFGLQPWKVIVVTNPEIRAKLRENAWGQAQVTDASHLVVFAIQKNLNVAYVDHYVDLVSKARGVDASALKGYADMMKGSVSGRSPEALKEWAARQAYIALGTLLVAAAEAQIDTCPMEGFDPAKFDEILGLSKLGLESVLVAPIGYRSSDDASAHFKKVRFPKEEIFVEVK